MSGWVNVRGGVVTARNFDVDVALGLVSGWETFRKFGMNPDIDSGTEEMWPPGTAKVLPTVAAAASAVSSSAEDDPDEATPPGTGAHTITIEGLDANYLEVSETITLTGTVASATTQTFIRINRAYNVTAGTNALNVGNISISVGGNLQAYIEANEGQTLQTHYTVPANKKLVITYFNLSTGRLGNADLAILSQVLLDGYTAWRTISYIQPYESQYTNTSSVTLLPSRTEIRQRIVATTTNAEAACVYGGYLILT